MPALYENIGAHIYTVTAPSSDENENYVALLKEGSLVEKS